MGERFTSRWLLSHSLSFFVSLFFVSFILFRSSIRPRLVSFSSCSLFSSSHLLFVSSTTHYIFSLSTLFPRSSALFSSDSRHFPLLATLIATLLYLLFAQPPRSRASIARVRYSTSQKPSSPSRPSYFKMVQRYRATPSQVLLSIYPTLLYTPRTSRATNARSPEIFRIFLRDTRCELYIYIYIQTRNRLFVAREPTS